MLGRANYVARREVLCWLPDTQVPGSKVLEIDTDTTA
jgi:hypothetical protein